MGSPIILMDEHTLQDFAISVGVALATRDVALKYSMPIIVLVAGGKSKDSGASWPHAIIFTGICLLVAMYLRFHKMPWDKWPLDEWHSKKEREKTIEPERQIIDPHHHIWDH
jgi:hypothetical protein